MKVKDLKSFIKLDKEISTLCVNIFNYVKENYIHKLRYGTDSLFCGKFLNEDGLLIKYYDYENIMSYQYLVTIPLHLLNDESLWKKFLDEYYD